MKNIKCRLTGKVAHATTATKQQKFEEKQAAMSDTELVELAKKEVRNLASSYGKSHHMSIPPMTTDTDMLLCELIRRFALTIKEGEK